MNSENLLPYLLKVYTPKQILNFFDMFDVEYYLISTGSVLQDPLENEFRLGVNFEDKYITWFIKGSPETLLNKFYRFKEIDAFM